MGEALRLARLGEGLTRPNPPVGAVVVRQGRIVGRGYHRKAGGPHAEVYALRHAGRQARGATLYVTLEPCSTWGRTPPCTDAILAAGIGRVVVALKDPNPRHAGRGFRVLRKAGIEVVRGCLSAEARVLLAPFTSHIVHQRPWITLKLAQTLDGRIADGWGTSRWISGPASRRLVQALRRRADAIMVGAGTARADDPSLLPRPDGGRRPYRLIVDAAGRSPATLGVFTDDARERTRLVTTRRCPAALRRKVEAQGVTVWTLPARGRGVSLQALMRTLHDAGLLHVVCEGGGQLAGALLAAGLVDEWVLFVAPKALGEGVPALGGVKWRLSAAPSWRVTEVARSGEDMLIRAAPAPKRRRGRSA
jgi:diaminohydroxyphosphoribosylaminopyrimidine deaminase/5-amino-6-(5-phosphoribosylamino)uracil reductase